MVAATWGAGLRVSLCLAADRRFELHYLHSVERTPVVEHYRAGPDGNLWLDGMRFRSSGWGLPSEGFRRRGTWFETTTPPRRLGRLVVRVSALAQQTLHVAGRVLVLRDLAPEGAALQLEVARARSCPVALVVRGAR